MSVSPKIQIQGQQEGIIESSRNLKIGREDEGLGEQEEHCIEQIGRLNIDEMDDDEFFEKFDLIYDCSFGSEEEKIQNPEANSKQ